MNYALEELAAVVGTLAEKYTARESTSVTYETAEQLMGAVLYCIQETERSERDSPVPAAGMSAQRAYEVGRDRVTEKTKKALERYHAVLPEFSCYGNHCLYENFVKGLPEFFKWYDIPFEPQNTILALDYPVLKDISGYTGIDRIYEFITCVSLEQEFLNAFPEESVANQLSQYNARSPEVADNVCEIVLCSVLERLLAGKSLSEPDLEAEDHLRIRELLARDDLDTIQERLKIGVEAFVRNCCGDCDGLSEYLSGAIGGILVRLKNRVTVQIL